MEVDDATGKPMTRLPDIAVEPDVLERARAGVAEAQSQLYRAFSDATYALIRRFVPRKAVADDLFQDTFIEVFQSLKRFRGEAPLGAWIRRIAVSKCLMYLRSPWHRSLLWLDTQAEDGQRETLRDLGVQIDPDQGAQLDLQAALGKLSATARAVVWLYDVEGYTHEEIAAQFGKTESFSKSQLMRAHLRLRELLDPSSETAACTPLSTTF
jgi:RNA polymerase sigma factor (sigma-70 family)